MIVKLEPKKKTMLLRLIMEYIGYEELFTSGKVEMLMHTAEKAGEIISTSDVELYLEEFKRLEILKSDQISRIWFLGNGYMTFTHLYTK